MFKRHYHLAVLGSYHILIVVKILEREMTTVKKGSKRSSLLLLQASSIRELGQLLTKLGRFFSDPASTRPEPTGPEDLQRRPGFEPKHLEPGGRHRLRRHPQVPRTLWGRLGSQTAQHTFMLLI